MATKTITLTGAEIAVTGLDGANAHIRNDGTDVIYAAKTAGITAGADGVLSIPAGQAATVYGISGTVYMLGTGSAQIISNDYSELPFKTSTASGGSAVDEQARTALGAHVGNAEIHVTAAEKENWNNKAELSDIPTTLPDEEARSEISEHAADTSIHVNAAEKANWDSKADGTHSHDDRYYTETEVDEKLAEKIDSLEKGVAGGVAELDESGKVPSEQLPASGGVGQNTTGTEYTIDGTTYTALAGAEIFNDYTNNKAFGRNSHAEGEGTIASGGYCHAEGNNTTASGTPSHAEGSKTTASGSGSHAEGSNTIASGHYSHAEGYRSTASSYASHACGKSNKGMTNSTGKTDNTGDAFVIGNGTSVDALSNAFRVTYGGAVYGLSAFNSSGADYAEFIKPWADGNPDGEDRVGYMVTIKNGLLCKANEGDYIVGITSGNPSVVGNADEDYYWRYERDEFNRFVYEDAEEEVEQLDDDGAPVLDENGMPVMVKTGNIIKNAHYKLAADYDPTKQNDYIERKNRPEWSYVGMLGVLPVRDDGTCVAGGFAKCGQNGIATRAESRGFDTFFVIERISDNVVSIELR